MDLRIQLEKLKDKPLVLERTFRPTDIDRILKADPPTGFTARNSVAFEGRLSKVNERNLVFQGSFQMDLAVSCNRCLEEVSVEVPVRFTLDLVRRSKEEEELFVSKAIEDDGQGEIAGTFTPEEANQLSYQGTEVDLQPAVREQILLALPMGALCGEDCRGLCQVCGANLNQGDCSCDRHVPDPRWMALRSIKLDN